MQDKIIIFVPGKNPKPPANQHRQLLWRALVEGVSRAAPELKQTLESHSEIFILTAWNYLYYHQEANIKSEIPWIEALINTPHANEQDIKEAKAWNRKLNRALYSIADYLPFLIQLLPEIMRMTALETLRYFRNENNIACEVREILKQVLRPLLAENKKILLIGHSLGSVIAYDTLWELSNLEHNKHKIDTFLSIGSPLGMRYVQKRLMGMKYKKPSHRYPKNIERWINVSAVGDLTALDQTVANDFKKMQKYGHAVVIKDYCKDIYNFYRNDLGLNTHRSYGYLVNPVIGEIIAQWWRR